MIRSDGVNGNADEGGGGGLSFFFSRKKHPGQNIQTHWNARKGLQNRDGCGLQLGIEDCVSFVSKPGLRMKEGQKTDMSLGSSAAEGFRNNVNFECELQGGSQFRLRVYTNALGGVGRG